jgi:glycosyltransferase involved in cell wall biosynthesis
LGLTLIEASGCECPVIVSDLPAVREVVEDGVTGRLVAPSDVDAWVTALDDLGRDDERLAEMARNARDRVLRRYDWEAVTQAYREALGACLAR